MARARPIERLSEVTAVIFDLDGVLLDSEPLHFRAARQVFSHHGKTLTDDAYRRSIGLGAVETWTAWKATYGLEAGVAELIELDEQGRLAEIGNGVVPIPEAVSLARRLHEGGVPLAIASSSTPETIDAELDALGLGDLFPVRVSGEHVARSKPAPDVYTRTAERLGVPPQSCVAIEDSPVGVRAAKAAGMTCVAVPTDWTANGDFGEADVTLESLRYFPLLLL